MAPSHEEINRQLFNEFIGPESEIQKTLNHLNALSSDHTQDIKDICLNTNTLIDGFKEQLKFNLKQEAHIHKLQEQIEDLSERNKALEQTVTILALDDG